MTAQVKSVPNSRNIHRHVLNNGIVVLVYENFAVQSVVINGFLRVGSQAETAEKNGLAGLAASGLMRGTLNRDFATIAGSLEDIGADLDVGAGTHRTSFGGKALAEDLSVLIELLADVLRYPSFPTDQIERMRGEIMTGLQIRSQDTRFRATRAFAESLYPPEHPYHYSVRGTLDTIPKITIDDIRAFHQAHFSPNGMLLVIVGAVTAESAVEIVRRHFEDWTNSNPIPSLSLPKLPNVTETRQVVVPLAGKSQTDFVLGTYGPSRFEPDYLAAILANCVLGQFGMMGRIGASVRETHGLAYYAYSSVEGGLGPSPWTVSAGVNPQNLDRALEQILLELRRITSEPVSEEDLANVQSYFVGRLPLQLESSEGIASSILGMEIYGLGLDYLVTYRERIYSLTREDLLAAAQRYLNPDAYVLGISGPPLN